MKKLIYLFLFITFSVSCTQVRDIAYLQNAESGIANINQGVFDEWCQKYNVPVIHPYNLGWGGLAFVVEPTGPQLKDFTDKWENFEVQLIERIVNYFKLWVQPKPWIEKIITQYKNEKSILPPPQLPIASWIAAGLCTNLLFCIATGQKTKRYPKFYLSSIIDDRN
jgi:hypothetical protein